MRMFFIEWSISDNPFNVKIYPVPKAAGISSLKYRNIFLGPQKEKIVAAFRWHKTFQIVQLNMFHW